MEILVEIRNTKNTKFPAFSDRTILVSDRIFLVQKLETKSFSKITTLLTELHLATRTPVFLLFIFGKLYIEKLDSQFEPCFQRTVFKI